MFDWSLQSLRDELASVEDTTQIIFAHPHYHNQKHIVHCLIDQPDTVYVSFIGDNLTAQDLITQTHTRFEDFVDMDINTVIFDECDRASQPEFNEFLQNYADSHRDQQIVVISRLVAYELLDNPDFRRRSQFVPISEDLMLFDYARRDPERTLIEVRAFGSGIVYVNGRQIEQWDGILPRQLFFYLADRGMATRNDIFATFWPKLNTREATNVFHVTKRKITDILGQSFTKFGGGFYRVSPSIDLSYDVVKFTEYIQSSVISDETTSARLLDTAINLYRAPYLNAETEVDDKWIGRRREELHEMYGEALSMIAQHKLDKGEIEQALGYFLNALRILNHHEDIVAVVMKLYHESGQTEDALALYDWIKNNLDTDYGIAPNATLQQLAESFRQPSLTA